MEGHLNKSLDEIIKETRQTKPRGQRREARKARPTKAAVAPNRRTATRRPAILERVGINSRLGGPRSTAAGGRSGGRSNAAPLNDASRRALARRMAHQAARMGVEPRAAGRRAVQAASASASSATATAPRNRHVSVSIKGEAGPTALFVGNLDPDVSAQDLKTCFQKYGTVKNCTLFYNSTGRSTGNAELVFKTKAAAETAVEKMHNVLADGRRLIVQLKGDGHISRDETRQQPAAAAAAPRSSRAPRNAAQTMDLD